VLLKETQNPAVAIPSRFDSELRHYLLNHDITLFASSRFYFTNKVVVPTNAHHFQPVGIFFSKARAIAASASIERQRTPVLCKNTIRLVQTKANTIKSPAREICRLHELMEVLKDGWNISIERAVPR
jgi:hypothetical protein